MSTPERPSKRQHCLLSELLAAGATPDNGVKRDQINSVFPISTWVAVERYGWVRVDRGTPDNVGGNPANYLYYPAANLKEILAAGHGDRPRTSHASEAHRRKGDDTAARRLRSRGWIVVPPETVEAIFTPEQQKKINDGIPLS